jgi:hypothetical protein
MNQTKAKKVATRPKKQPVKKKLGADGTVIQTRSLRNWSTLSVHTVKARVRSGGFEWRYGARQTARYHAGSEYARLWERAGIASACAASLDGTGGGAGWEGLPDARMAAIDRLRAINAKLGSAAIQRIAAYVVDGKLPKEIATGYPDINDRQMAAVLDMDLLNLSEVMGYKR